MCSRDKSGVRRNSSTLVPSQHQKSSIIMEVSSRKTKCCSCCLCYMIVSCPLTAAILVGSSVVLLLLFPMVLRQQVEERVVIREGSPLFEQLLSPSVPVFKDIYFFNLSNPEEFERGAKPQLVEVGPYSYRETRQKSVLNVSSDGSLLTYNQTRLFHFSEETTAPGLSESDTICTINLPLVAAAAQLEQSNQGFLVNVFGPAILRGIFDDKNARLFTCQPPTPLAFEYTDELIQELSTNLALRLSGQNLPTPSVSINANNSADNALPSIIHTGVGDPESTGQYVQWQGNNGTLEVWPNGMGANDINGTEGLVFGSFLEPGQELEIFVDDTMRTLQLVYTDTVNDGGVEAHRYMLANSTFESAFTNPANARWGSWCPDGMFFLGPIQEPEVPVFGSKPHFLDGDPVLREGVEGLRPDRQLHESFVDVEPLTGANVMLNVQLQINAQVNQSDDFQQLENINGTLYFPMLYIRQHTVLTQQFVDFLLDNGLRAAYILPTLVRVLAGLMIVGAVIALLVSVLACCLCVRRRRGSLKKQSPSIALTAPASVLQPPSGFDHTHSSTGPIFEEREEDLSDTNDFDSFEDSFETSQEPSNGHSTFIQ